MANEKINDLTSAPALARAQQIELDVGGATAYKTTLGDVRDWMEFVFNVQDPAYGAVGDGSNNDTTAIQAAIDACEAAGGGTVYFPRGNYKVTASLTVNDDSVRLIGDGKQASKIHTADTTVTTLRVGTLSTSTKINHIVIQGLKIDAAAGASAGVYALEVFGVSFFKCEEVEGKNGASALYVQNLDQFTFKDCLFEVNDSGAIAVELVQGDVDDVTIGAFINVGMDYNAANCSALKFGDGVGSANANEFNRIAFMGCRIGGDNYSGTTCIELEAGARNTTFIATQLRYGRVASVDCSGVDASYKVRLKFLGCAFYGNGTNPTADHVILNQSNQSVDIEFCELTQANQGISCKGNSPNVALRNVEVSQITEGSNAGYFVNIESGTPHISVSGYGEISSSSVDNRIGGAAFSSADINFARDVSGDWRAREEGSVTITSGNTSASETYTAMDFPVDKRDVHYQLNANPTNDPGSKWLTSVTDTGFNINCENDPGASGAAFVYTIAR